MSSTAGGADVALLRDLLAAEHAAVYGYGVLGARLDPVTRRLALSAFDAHRASRDTLVARLRDRGADGPVAAGAYDVTVPDAAASLALAVRLEEGLGARWLRLVTGTDDAALRSLGASGLSGTAVRAAQWRGRQGAAVPTVALPGA